MMIFKIKIKEMVTMLSLLGMIILSPSAVFAFDQTYYEWDKLLRQTVNDGLVDYSSILKDHKNFVKVVSSLESITRDEYNIWSESQKKAFWINAYNIGAMKHILNNYPIKKAFGLSALRYPANSIQQIPDVWNKPVLSLLGEKVSLNHIENEVLRKDFEDPRIHFAIVCASIGCPVLREEAYVSDQLDSQLDDQANQFVRTSSKFRYDAGKDILFLSPIFKWFGGDFEKKGGVISFLKGYAPSDIASKLSNSTRIEWQDYDWGLNEQK